MKIVELLCLHIQLGSLWWWWFPGVEFSLIAAEGPRNAPGLDRVEYVEYNLESNLSHLSFRFQRSFFACHRCTDQNYRLCCERHQICCHFVYQCPPSDSVQCIQPCDNGCAVGQICCPRRRKMPCCSLPAHTYIIPPVRKLRSNNSYQLSNTTKAVENIKVNMTFIEPLSQTSEYSSDGNSSDITTISTSTDFFPNSTETEANETSTPIEQLLTSNFSQVFNDDQGFSADETTTVDNEESTTDRLVLSTTIATVETLSDPEMENISYFAETTTSPTIFPDFFDVSSSNSSGNESENFDSTFNSSYEDEESTPATWWNSEEPTSIWNIKNVDEEFLNTTSNFQSTEDEGGAEVSYFPAEYQIALLDTPDRQVKINATKTSAN